MAHKRGAGSQYKGPPTEHSQVQPSLMAWHTECCLSVWNKLWTTQAPTCVYSGLGPLALHTCRYMTDAQPCNLACHLRLPPETCV